MYGWVDEDMSVCMYVCVRALSILPAIRSAIPQTFLYGGVGAIFVQHISKQETKYVKRQRYPPKSTAIKQLSMKAS